MSGPQPIERFVSKKLTSGSNPRYGYIRRRGWKDLIFLCVLAILALAARHSLQAPALSDLDKWKRRPPLSPHAVSIANRPAGQSNVPPCFFLAPRNSSDRSPIPGSVGDCLLLTPDGRNLNLFEVDPYHGFLPVRTDLYVPDTMPLAFTRTYAPLDDWARRNKVYLPNVYNLFFFGRRHRGDYQETMWWLPDRREIDYRRISPGTGFGDAVFENDPPISKFGASRIDWNGWGWDLRLEDGTTYLSPEAYNANRAQQGSIVGIFDKKGDEVRVSRKRNGDLTEIISPGGHWIRLTYDGGGKIVRASDSLGESVSYDYDSDDRINSIRYSTGETTAYSYDSANRIIRAEDAAEGLDAHIEYGLDGTVTRVRTGAREYSFLYWVDTTKTVHIDIYDSTGPTTEITIHGLPDKRSVSYTVQKLEGVQARF